MGVFKLPPCFILCNLDLQHTLRISATMERAAIATTRLHNDAEKLCGQYHLTNTSFQSSIVAML